MADSFSVKFDADSAFAGLDALDDAIGEVIRPAAYAGAKVLTEEVQSNVDAIGPVTGNLARSIYHAYSEDSSVPGKRATYHVSWNASKAPHGHLLEYGHMQTHGAYIGSDGQWYSTKHRLADPRFVAARPFVRPAYDTKAAAALEAARARFVELGREKIAQLKGAA